MKIFITLLLALALTACGGGGTNNNSSVGSADDSNGSSNGQQSEKEALYGSWESICEYQPNSDRYFKLLASFSNDSASQTIQYSNNADCSEPYRDLHTEGTATYSGTLATSTCIAQKIDITESYVSIDNGRNIDADNSQGIACNDNGVVYISWFLPEQLLTAEDLRLDNPLYPVPQ